MVAESCRIGAHATDDDMIEELYVHGSGRFPELAGDVNVGRARRRVA